MERVRSRRRCSINQLIASFDLETTSLTGDTGVLLCAQIKPWKEKLEEYCIGDLDNILDDRDIVEQVARRLAEFNILIAHNGIKFDRPFLNTRLAFWGLDIVLPPDGAFVDPVKLARKHLRLGTNSLARVSEHLRTKHRKDPLSLTTWMKAFLGRDPTAYAQIVKHCQQDVLVLEEVAYRLRKFIKRINEWGSA